MGDLVLKGATSGQITVAPTAIAGTNTLTLPANSGTVLTTGAAVTVPQGGTGQTSFTANGLLYASGTTTLANGSSITYNGTRFEVASKQSYFDPYFAGVGGVNINATFSYNNNSANSMGTWSNGFMVFYVVAAAGCTVIPVFSNGGGGVGWQLNMFDPDAGTFVNGTGPTVNFTQAGTGGNTYSIVIAGGTGATTIQRTAGSQSYTVFVQVWGIV